MACDQVRTLAAGDRRVYRLPSPEAITLRELVATLNAVVQSYPVKAVWGERPFRKREVFMPWEGAEVLPGWCPEIPLDAGLRELGRCASVGDPLKER